MTATYTKLRNGSWGLRVKGSATVGDQVTVTKRDGTVKYEYISLCAIDRSRNAMKDNRDRTASKRYYGTCRAAGCHNPADQDCSYGRATSGYCGACAYDEF